jgi:cytochrome c-type biogenesis protein
VASIASDSFVSAVQSGPLAVALVVSVLVGLVGFVSPCVLPLVPGYLAYVAGMSVSRSVGRRRVLAGATLFVVGFSVLFVSEGFLLGRVGELAVRHSRAIERIVGALVLSMGVIYLGFGRYFQREVRIRALPAAGLISAPVLGFVFGLGWSPCLTPTLAAVEGLAYDQAGAWRGAFLAAGYCLGLGAPFLILALGISWAASVGTFVRSHRRAVHLMSGCLVMVIGLSLLTGFWEHGMLWLRNAGSLGSIGASM